TRGSPRSSRREIAHVAWFCPCLATPERQTSSASCVYFDRRCSLHAVSVIHGDLCRGSLADAPPVAHAMARLSLAQRQRTAGATSDRGSAIVPSSLNR